MFLYEIVDHFGRTVLEIGRFRSDAEASVASKKILVPKGSSLVRRSSSGVHEVMSLGDVKLPKGKALERLLSLCRSSSDRRVVAAAKEYEHE